jgi:hypothetical protein
LLEVALGFAATELYAGGEGIYCICTSVAMPSSNEMCYPAEHPTQLVGLHGLPTSKSIYLGQLRDLMGLAPACSQNQGFLACQDT